MKAVWIPTGYCFLNASYHRQRFEDARAGGNFTELRSLQTGLLTNDLIPSRHELMLFWELLVRTRFNDQNGPAIVESADKDEKFLDVRERWERAGNPEIETNGHQTELATVMGLAALDVAFRDALLDASVEEPALTRENLSGVLLDHQHDWGRYVLNFDEIGQLASFLAEIKPMGRQNPLEIFHERAWIQPRKAACPLGVSLDPERDYAYVSHSALLRKRYVDKDPGFKLAAAVDGVAREVGVGGRELFQMLRDAGILIERR